MASYRGHLMLSTPLGLAYGGLALSRPEFDWGAVALGAGFTTVGGLMPDLDSDSGVPVRELFGIVAAAAAVALLGPLREQAGLGLSLEQTLTVLGGVYFLIRYGLARFFRKITVHRGMFHSLPAMLIAGVALYLAYPSRDVVLKLYLAGGVMLGFLSHLVLDEIWAVDFMGVGIRFNKYAGSAVKFASPSYAATLTTYAILFALVYVAWSGTPEWASRLPVSWNEIPWPRFERQAGAAP